MSLTALAIALSFATAPVLAAADLSSVQWKNRVLVLLANDGGDALYVEQQNLLDAVRDGLAERDMLVLGITGNIVTTLFGDVEGFDVDAVRSIGGGEGTERFEAVLIGKDGGVKQRWTIPVAPEVLFAIIDAMPMRANEMRR